MVMSAQPDHVVDDYCLPVIDCNIKVGGRIVGDDWLYVRQFKTINYNLNISFIRRVHYLLGNIIAIRGYGTVGKYSYKIKILSGRL